MDEPCVLAVGCGVAVLRDGSLIPVPACGTAAFRFRYPYGSTIVEHPFAAHTDDDGPVYLHPSWRIWAYTHMAFSAIDPYAIREQSRRAAARWFGTSDVVWVGASTYADATGARGNYGGRPVFSTCSYVAIPLVAIVQARLRRAV